MSTFPFIIILGIKIVNTKNIIFTINYTKHKNKYSRGKKTTSTTHKYYSLNHNCSLKNNTRDTQLGSYKLNVYILQHES